MPDKAAPASQARVRIMVFDRLHQKSYYAYLTSTQASIYSQDQMRAGLVVGENVKFPTLQNWQRQGILQEVTSENVES